jgi:hypothetical protein
LFRAHIQVGANEDFELHYPAAYELLDEVVNADLELFRPAGSAGWDVEGCRLAVQDCLDVFQFAQEWFRGATPEILVGLSAAPADSAATIEARMTTRMMELAERILALRALEETQRARQGVAQGLPPWSGVWSTMREDIRSQFESGVHPAHRHCTGRSPMRWVRRRCRR